MRPRNVSLEIDNLSKRIDAIEFQSTYTERHTRPKVKVRKLFIVALAVLAMLLALIFMTDKVVSADDLEFASTNTTYTVRRDEVVISVASAKTQTTKSITTTTVAGTPSLTGVESKTIDVPIMTRKEIGGYGSGMSDAVKNAIVGGNSSVQRENTKAWMASHISSKSGGDKLAAQSSYDSNTGAAMTQGRYLSAIGSYFWDNVGYFKNDYKIRICYDVVLKDGTTIPCVSSDAKADADTNSASHSSVSDKRYEHMFQQLDGSVIEIVTETNADVNKFADYFKISDSNPIVQIIVYNKKLDV